jgi:hypothetical protein
MSRPQLTTKEIRQTTLSEATTRQTTTPSLAVVGQQPLQLSEQQVAEADVAWREALSKARGGESIVASESLGRAIMIIHEQRKELERKLYEEKQQGSHDADQLQKAVEDNRRLQQLIGDQEKEIHQQKEQIRERDQHIVQISMGKQRPESVAAATPFVAESTPVRPTVELREPSVPLTHVSMAATTSHRSEKLPDPDQFDNGSHQQYRSWERQMRNKLKLNRDRIGDLDHQLAYCSTRIKGMAADYMEPWLDPYSRNRITNPDEFFEMLRNRFADPFSQETAREEFRKLYQGRRDFQEFLGDFYRLSAEGEYSEQQKIEELKDKINVELSQGLVGLTITPTSFRSFVEYLQKVDRQLKLNKQKAAKITNRQRGSPAPQAAASAAPKPATETAERRTYNPQCYRCQQFGHISRDCPKGGAPAKA